MIEVNTYITCPKCKGTGIAETQKGTEDPCQMCEGLGGIKNGFVDIAVIMKKLRDIMREIKT